jgi:hypothetical protein
LTFLGEKSQLKQLSITVSSNLLYFKKTGLESKRLFVGFFRTPGFSPAGRAGA